MGKKNMGYLMWFEIRHEEIRIHDLNLSEK